MPAHQYTLQHFAEFLADQLGTPKGKTYDSCREAFELMATHVSKGGRAALHAFGSFTLVARRPRKGRNPRTGEIIPIPARKVVVFKAAKSVREMARSRKGKK